MNISKFIKYEEIWDLLVIQVKKNNTYNPKNFLNEEIHEEVVDFILGDEYSDNLDFINNQNNIDIDENIIYFRFGESYPTGEGDETEWFYISIGYNIKDDKFVYYKEYAG